MKPLQSIIIVFSILIVLFGFSQLNNEQDIFIQSEQHCCNQGQCKGANCISPSSIEAGSLCDTYLLTCKDCIDLEYSGCLDNCSNKKNDYCMNNGVPYYGIEVLCLEQK